MTESGNADRTARAVVWLVWTGMLALLLWSYLPIASRVPLAEDWYTVPLLTGQPVSLSSWLWEQNNEHRMPVARLLLLAVLKVAGGDYRAGGLLNMALLAGGAAGLILFARHLRGGMTDVADAFFPLTLLHFCHSVDVLFPFQITFVLSLAFIIVVGCTLYLPRSVSSASAAAVAGIALLFLPLSGFIGLLFVPPMAAYIAWAGWCCRSGTHGWPETRRVGSWLLSASTGALVLGAPYFVGYEHPWWNPANPGIVPSIKVILKMLSLGFGAAPFFLWMPGVAGAVLFLTASSWVAARALMQKGRQRKRAIGRALFLGTSLGFAAAVGWGRAGYAPDIGIPLRYVSIALPAFVAGYLTWVISPSRASRMIQRALAVTLLILVPINTIAGHRMFADWYHEGMSSFEGEVRRGIPIDELAKRHNRFLVHWWTPDELARHMRMLQAAGIPPFDTIAGDAAEQR
jgi:hypothetical protein